MIHSHQERVAHVYRRLGIGSYPELVESTSDPQAAIARALDLTTEAPAPYRMTIPTTEEDARNPEAIGEPIRWWLESMRSSPRLIEERLIWFCQDHFATSLRKVRVPYLLWGQHLTIRAGATTSFADLLHSMSTDPAMLIFLDGITNRAGAVNENYARELLELHTMGPGNYNQADVLEAARAATGWVVAIPYLQRQARAATGLEPWSAGSVASRHDGGAKTVFGVTDTYDLSGLIDHVLDQPATGRFVATKLWNELVGTPIEPSETDRLGKLFASDYQVMNLVHEIAAHPAFLSDDAIRAKVRTPVERLVAIAQAFATEQLPSDIGLVLNDQAYLPFNPPNPAGFPKGEVLLGPHQLIHGFDLLAASSQVRDLDPDDALRRLGLFDVSEKTRGVLETAPDPLTGLALAANSPEFYLV